jgi:hypothetical protein
MHCNYSDTIHHIFELRFFDCLLLSYYLVFEENICIISLSLRLQLYIETHSFQKVRGQVRIAPGMGGTFREKQNSKFFDWH